VAVDHHAGGGHAFWLTLEIALIAVPLNTIFRIIALALVRGRFRGRSG
jgi:sulfate transport system permease protein